MADKAFADTKFGGFITGLFDIFGRLIGASQADTDYEREMNRISLQNSYNKQRDEADREYNSIPNQVAQAKEAGYNLNYFQPSFQPSTSTPQIAGSDPALSRKSALLGGLASILSDALPKAIDQGWTRSLQNRKLNLLQQYRQAQLDLAQDKLNEVKRVNDANILSVNTKNSINQKILDNWDDDHKLDQALKGARIRNINSSTRLNSTNEAFLSSVKEYRIAYEKAKSHIASLDDSYETNLHNNIYTDAYWADMKAQQVAARRLQQYLENNGYNKLQAELMVKSVQAKVDALNDNAEWRKNHPYYDETMNVLGMVGKILGASEDAYGFGKEIGSDVNTLRLRHGYRRTRIY